jgi:hypothetical protein
MQVTFGAEVARRLLRYELQRLLDQTGTSHAQAGEAIGLSRPGFTLITRGTNLPSKSALIVLAKDVFHREDRLQPMVELLAIAKLKPSKSGPPPTRTIEDFALFVGLEGSAAGIEVFEPAVVSGLLQTEAYARELMNYDASIRVGVDVEQALEIRTQRQKTLLRTESPTNLWFFCEEHALRRPVGGPTVLAGQYDHLLTMTDRPNVNLQIIPHEVAVHPALSGAFTMFRFEDDWRVAYEATQRSAYYYDQAEAVEQYDHVLNHLRHLTLTPKESRAMLAKMRKELPQ